VLRNSSIALMQRLLVPFYKTNVIAKSSVEVPERHAEFTFGELERLVYSASALKERLTLNRR
jgi:hypothetical protein